ncbi:MAG: RHS repeat-associated core domain-containing protein [Alistipes sp.]|nr:RHS repeat-associated core domain-containing protein [Alistipes sp.]
MPRKISRGDDILVNYVYLADGSKYSALKGDGTGFVYEGSFIYSKDVDGNLKLESIPFNGGRFISNSNGELLPRYFITDHLGSVRGILNENFDFEEQNDYYQFGKHIDDPNSQLSDNRYHYNGKENQEFFDLPYLDYGARLYDPHICRWLCIDPMAEIYYPISPYVYCANNPINIIDPNGMDIYRFDKTTGELFLHTETDDDFDQIGKFVYNKKSDTYELKTDKKGTAKILIDNIEKGILSDGLNLKTNSNTINVNGKDDSFISRFENFIVQFSDMIGREISGYYFNNNESGRINEIYIGRYENNTYNESVKGTSAKNLPLGFFNNKSFQTDWHTHPSDAPDIARLRPSSKDIESRNNTKNKYDIKEYVILTNGHRVCYTNW